MKLVIATPLYPPDPGGPATYAKLLEEELPKRGIDVTVVKFGDVRHLPKVISHITYFFKILKAARKADVILSLDALSVGWPTVFANFFLRKKLIIKMVGDHIWEQGTQRFNMQGTLDDVALFSTKWHPYLAFLRALQQVSMHAANQILVPSEYLEGVVLSWGIPKKKISVIYNAVEVGEVGQTTFAVPHPAVLSVGRLVPWKGMKELIDAVALVREKIPEVHLLIVGDGPERGVLEAHGKEKLGDHVQFLGAKPHEETLALIKAADVYALNSTYEGLAHTLIEALMLGSAIVASDAGGNPELIEDQHNGLLVPTTDTHALANALAHLLTEEELRDRLKKQARVSSEKFSIGHMLDEVCVLLKRV